MQRLSTDEIGKSYKGRQVVRGVSLDVCQGEVVGLLGPNGAGKTTSFYMIVGLVRPDAGRILADGEDITQVPMYMRARQYGISYLPQEASVFRKLTVEENMLAVLEAQSISAADPALPHREAHRPAQPRPYPQDPRLSALWRRTAARRDRPLPLHPALLHSARRALFGN